MGLCRGAGCGQPAACVHGGRRGCQRRRAAGTPRAVGRIPCGGRLGRRGGRRRWVGATTRRRGWWRWVSCALRAMGRRRRPPPGVGRIVWCRVDPTGVGEGGCWSVPVAGQQPAPQPCQGRPVPGSPQVAFEVGVAVRRDMGTHRVLAAGCGSPQIGQRRVSMSGNRRLTVPADTARVGAAGPHRVRPARRAAVIAGGQARLPVFRQEPVSVGAPRPGRAAVRRSGEARIDASTEAVDRFSGGFRRPDAAPPQAHVIVDTSRTLTSGNGCVDRVAGLNMGLAPVASRVREPIASWRQQVCSFPARMSLRSSLTWTSVWSSHRFVGGFFSSTCRFLDDLAALRVHGHKPDSARQSDGPAGATTVGDEYSR